MLTDIERKHITIGLTELLSLSFPVGSLTRDADFFEKPRTAAGIAERICDENGGYVPCHSYHADYPCGDYTCTVTAVPDLSLVGDGGAEVLSVRASGGKKSAPDTLYDYWQRELICCAAVAADQAGIRAVSARLIYADGNRYGTEDRVVCDDYAAAEEVLLCCIEKAARLIAFSKEKLSERLPAAKNAAFPFAQKRAGQTAFMKQVLSVAKNGGRVLCEAPTGIGKTMSALFPSVKAFGHGYIDRIFYLTPKTTAQYAAENALKTMFPAGNGIRSIILSAKDKMCASDAADNAPRSEAAPEVAPRLLSRTENKCDDCPFSQDYYCRQPDALSELLLSGRNLTPDAVREVALRHRVCPYELSLDASEYCDAIICDCNYLFDCRVYLRRYFDFSDAGTNAKHFGERYAVLIDEAHNLCDRARNMYTHTLRLSLVEKAISAIGPTETEAKLRAALETMQKTLGRYEKECRENTVTDEDGTEIGQCVHEAADEALLISATEMIEAYENARRTGRFFPQEAVTDLYFDLKDLLKKSPFFGAQFRVFCQKTPKELSYKILCLDPSVIMSDRMDAARCCVLFSATLTPPEYYLHTLGLGDNGNYVRIPSPYDRDNLSLTVFDRLSTRYADRTQTLPALIDIIHTAVSARRGNYMVFFPSYRYMEDVYRLYSTRYRDSDLLLQTKGMTDAQKAAFVARFDSENTRSLVGFCVLGGVYAEGIDLVGERLIGSIIVGVGMPRLSSERNLLAAYCTERDTDGQGYAYIIPGMTRVAQAVGRVIRSETDRGIAVLIDDRFSQPTYRALFPDHWRHAKFVSFPMTLEKLLRRFWGTDAP